MANLISKYLSHADDWRHPIWTLRTMPILIAVALLLSMTVWTSGALHGACLGFAFGQLIALSGVVFKVKDVTLRRDLDASPVQQLSLNS